MAAGLIAFGAGLLLSSLIPASRAEQRAAEGLKDQAAPLVDEAKQAAQQLREDLEPAAREAADTLLSNPIIEDVVSVAADEEA